MFVDPTGERAKLADFGIAKVIGARERNALVTSLIGTIAYMAPEQKTYGSRVGPWTDVYLLARTLAEFVGAHASSDGDVTLPDDASAEAALAVLRQGLAIEPKNRPADAHEFGRLLGGALANVA